MLSAIAGSEIVLAPMPKAHFGVGAVGKLPGIVRGLGSDGVVVVTDAALAATPVVARVAGVLEAAGIPVTVFSGGRRSTRPRASRSPPSTRSGGGTWIIAASSHAPLCRSWRFRRPPAPAPRRTRSAW